MMHVGMTCRAGVLEGAVGCVQYWHADGELARAESVRIRVVSEHEWCWEAWMCGV